MAAMGGHAQRAALFEHVKPLTYSNQAAPPNPPATAAWGQWNTSGGPGADPHQVPGGDSGRRTQSRPTRWGWRPGAGRTRLQRSPGRGEHLVELNVDRPCRPPTASVAADAGRDEVLQQDAVRPMPQGQQHVRRDQIRVDDINNSPSRKVSPRNEPARIRPGSLDRRGRWRPRGAWRSARIIRTASTCCRTGSGEPLAIDKEVGVLSTLVSARGSRSKARSPGRSLPGFSRTRSIARNWPLPLTNSLIQAEIACVLDEVAAFSTLLDGEEQVVHFPETLSPRAAGPPPRRERLARRGVEVAPVMLVAVLAQRQCLKIT